MKSYLSYVFILLCIGSIIFHCFWFERIYAKQKQYPHMITDCSLSEITVLEKEMHCFPVCKDQKEKYYFDNGYGGVRSYGGKRKHEGIDIMTSNNRSGYFQIQSATDGVVEQIGWLRLGGYRIGIRSKHGFYYYYAHLDSYASGMKKGKKVRAGQILGTMGDTGYGKEGTKGKFDVHLHFGIYRQKEGKETCINPYDILVQLEKGSRRY